MRISYFYDMEFPSRTAASIRIVNTCHPFCLDGTPVTLYTSRMLAAHEDQCLEFYGLPPTANLKVVPILERSASFVETRRRIAAAMAAESNDEPHFVFTRGESGLEVMRHLRTLHRPPGRKYVFEAHRLCFLHAAENRKDSSAIKRIKSLENAAVNAGDGLVCVTPAVLETIVENFRPSCPTLILPNGAVLPKHLPADDSREIDVLYMGKPLYRKGVQDLVRAMKFLRGRRLHLVGGTTKQIADLSRLAERCGVSDQITMTGFVPPAEVRSFLGRARVGVCPLPRGVSVIADRFTCPIKILEMMAWGVPVVATDMPPVRALLEHGRTALLVEPNRPEALAQAIRRLLEDRPLARQLAQRARAQVAKDTWQQRANCLREFLGSL